MLAATVDAEPGASVQDGGRRRLNSPKVDSADIQNSGRMTFIGSWPLLVKVREHPVSILPLFPGGRRIEVARAFPFTHLPTSTARKDALTLQVLIPC